MKILSFILYVIGIIFCILAFAGHTAAWSAAALCFFAGYQWLFFKKEILIRKFCASKKQKKSYLRWGHKV